MALFLMYFYLVFQKLCMIPQKAIVVDGTLTPHGVEPYKKDHKPLFGDKVGIFSIGWRLAGRRNGILFSAYAFFYAESNNYLPPTSGSLIFALT